MEFKVYIYSLADALRLWTLFFVCMVYAHIFILFWTQMHLRFAIPSYPSVTLFGFIKHLLNVLWGSQCKTRASVGHSVNIPASGHGVSNCLSSRHRLNISKLTILFFYGGGPFGFFIHLIAPTAQCGKHEVAAPFLASIQDYMYARMCPVSAFTICWGERWTY